MSAKTFPEDPLVNPNAPSSSTANYIEAESLSLSVSVSSPRKRAGTIKSHEHQSMNHEDDQAKEGYDIFWQHISKSLLTSTEIDNLMLLFVDDHGHYESKFPLKRYQSALSQKDNHNPDKNISCIAVLYTPDESEYEAILITGSDDQTVRMWDVYETSFIQMIKCPENVTALATYTPSEYLENTVSSKVLICGGNENAYALLWDFKTNTTRELFPLGKTYHEKYISSAIIHEPYQRTTQTYEDPIIVIGSSDKSVSVWDLKSESLIFKLPKEHTDLLLSIAVHDPGRGRNGLHIITGSWDKTVLFFEFSIGLQHFQESLKEADVSLEQQPVSSPHHHNHHHPSPPHHHNLKTHYHKLRGHTKSVTTIAAYNLQGNPRTNQGNHCSVLVTGSLDKTVIIWDIESKEKVRTLRGHEQKITTVLIYESRSGSPPIVITGSEDGKGILWDLLSGEMIRELSFPGKVLCQTLVLNEYGLILVTGSPKATTTITNLCRTERIRKFLTSAVTAIACYTPRETDVNQDPLVLIGTIDNSCSLFDLATHRKIAQVERHTSRINAAVIYTPPDPTQHPLVISCDGKAVVVVWDLFTHEEVKSMTDHSGAVFCVGLFEPHRCPDVHHFHPDRADNAISAPRHAALDLTRPILITGGIDKQLIFWDLLGDSSHHKLATIAPTDPGGTHSNFIRSMVVHHPVTANEEPLFITGSYDRTVVVWNLRYRTKLYTMTLHSDYVFFLGLYDPKAHVGANYHRDGIDQEFFQYPALVTTSFDSTIAVWSLKPYQDPNTTANTHIHTKEKATHFKPKEKTTDNVPRLKYHLKEHRDSVTALNVYVPKQKEETPLIVSGSIDRTVIVWNLFTGDVLQRLIGHTDRVCFITTYIPKDGRHPLVLSGSDDRTTILWEDSLYSKPFMPLRDDVNRCFDSDCLEEDWPLITDLARVYQTRLFLVNSNLFFLAVKYNRPDFLLKFRRYLTIALPLIRSYGQQNLLTYAVGRNDLISVRILLLCWKENLNKDIQDLLTQRMYHAMYFFPDQDLELLAKKYPVEFKHFITSLRLIRNHPSLLLDSHNEPVISAFHRLHRDHHSDKIHKANHEYSPGRSIFHRDITFQHQMSNLVQSLYTQSHLDAETKKQVHESLNKINNTRVLKLHPMRRYEVGATDDPVVPFDQLWYKTFIAYDFRSYLTKLWQEFIYDTTDPQPVTSLMIPLRNTAKLKESLFLFVKVSNQLDSVDLFNSDVGMISLHYFWEFHAKQFHIFAFGQYLVLLILFMTAVYVYEFYYLTELLTRGQSVAILILNGVVLAGFGYYIFEEVNQYRHEQSHFTIRSLLEHFLLDLWNFVDVAIICTAGVGIALRYPFNDDTTIGRSFLAVGSIFMWFKVLYFLRPFSDSGPLGKE